MCNDDGCVIDDGVVVKLGENDYYFTTSTGRAGQTVEWIRYHTRFDGWDFSLVNLTDAMGVINISGPNARKVLAKVVDIDLSNDGLSLFRVPGVHDQGHHFRARHAPGICGGTVHLSCTFPHPTLRRSGICSRLPEPNSGSATSA
jgi:glycine cleavage system aminomethyltransferase T